MQGHLLRYFAIIIVSLISLKVLLYFLDADQGLGFGCQAEFEVPLPPLLCNGLQFCVGILVCLAFLTLHTFCHCLVQHFSPPLFIYSCSISSPLSVPTICKALSIFLKVHCTFLLTCFNLLHFYHVLS